jgi:hypothetical protein
MNDGVIGFYVWIGGYGKNDYASCLKGFIEPMPRE